MQRKISSFSYRDVPALAGLEDRSSAYGWNQRKIVESISGSHHCFKLSKQEVILGYCVLRQVATELELLNIVIDTEYQSQGNAVWLLEQVFCDQRYRDITDIWLEVRESNDVALRLYNRLSFQQTGIRKGYYPTKTGREDAITMRRTGSLSLSI